MTRPLPLAAVALLLAAACSAPEAPQATATPTPAAPPTPPPVAVHILLPAEPDAAVKAWAQELAAAISSGQGGLVLAATPEEAAAVLRIDAVEEGTEADPQPQGEGDLHVMRGALLVGEASRDFNLAYRGDARPQAEALARNLRHFAADVAASASGQGQGTETEEAAKEGTAASEPGEEPTDTEDEG